jgi:phosphatidate cytidylyltransferase
MRILGRIVIGTVLGLLVFAVIAWLPDWTLAILTAAWSVLATLEFARLLRKADIELTPWLLAVLNASVSIAAWLGWLPGYMLAPIAALLVMSVLGRVTKPRIPVYGSFSVIYLGFLPAHLVMLRQATASHSLSFWLVMFPLLLTWINDTAAWGIGKLFGRTKLMPELSPKKTWEGFAAGVVASAVFAGFFLGAFAPFAGRPWPVLAILGIGLGTLAQVGDLFESMFKRAVGTKDTSNVLGEHGGFLDRVDSLLFTIPAFYYLLLSYLR